MNKCYRSHFPVQHGERPRHREERERGGWGGERHFPVKRDVSLFTRTKPLNHFYMFESCEPLRQNLWGKLSGGLPVYFRFPNNIVEGWPGNLYFHLVSKEILVKKNSLYTGLVFFFFRIIFSSPSSRFRSLSKKHNINRDVYSEVRLVQWSKFVFCGFILKSRKVVTILYEIIKRKLNFFRRKKERKNKRSVTYKDIPWFQFFPYPLFL